jgi:flagellar assembly protein FliH
MANVIKAAGFRDSDVGPWHHDQLVRQANSFLTNIRDQARQILLAAAHDAQEIRQAADAEGHRAGEQAIDRMVDEKVGRQLETLLPALRAAIAGVCDSKHAWLAHWERQAVQLSAAIAARVCRRELATHSDLTLGLVREALELAVGAGQVRVLLHPDDHAALGEHIRRLVAEFGRLASAQVVADATISRGGCRVETTTGVIDQQIEAQLARIVEELL